MKDFFKAARRRIPPMTNATGRWTALLAGLLFLASAAHGLAAGELAGGPPRILSISPETCAELSTYLSNEAEYQPGVAADGSTVAPADIDPVYEPRTTFSFPIEIEPFGAANPQFSPNTAAVVADVTIDAKTGRTTIDGQEVTGADRALADACARQSDHPAH
jgi:hypothetical protein